MYAAVLDACALVPVSLADTLLRIAEHGLYRPLWSEQLLYEAQDAILRAHPGIDPARAARRFAAMRGYFPDAMVTGWEPLEAGFQLPDPDDRHVLAAAIRGSAQAIVTFNLKDFPAQILDPFDIEAIHPDDFLGHQLELAPELVLQAIREQAAATATPPLSITRLLQILERAGGPAFAAACREQLTTDDLSNDPDPAAD